MNRLARYPQLVLLVLVLGLLSLTFGSPLVTSLASEGSRTLVGRYSGDGWAAPFFRSAVFAFVTTIVCIPTALFVALRVKDCAQSLHGFLAILMAPMLMGGVAVGFCVKLDILRSDLAVGLIADRAFGATWGLMLVAQAWQLLSLATYLFWFRLQSVPRALLGFSQASHLTSFEYARDVYWPHVRNLAGVLSLFAATTTFYEFAKFHLVLRASPGSDTELASHWLLRFYNFYAAVDPSLASRYTLAMAAAGIPLAIGAALTAIAVTVAGMDLCTRYLAKVALPPRRRHTAPANVVAIAAIVLTIAPVTGLVPYLRWHAFAPIDEILRSVALALTASILAVLLSVLLGIAGRVLLRRTMERFDSGAALVLALLYFLQVIPAIAVALCGYFWLGILSGRDTVARWVPVLWLLCQIVIVLPLTASFVQISHFRVRTEELDFQESAKVGVGDLIGQSFLRRFSLDYLLVAIFGFSIIWTESTVNATLSNLSRSIPSIAVELTQRVDGRGASYSEAAGLILATLMPVALGLSLWVFDLRRRRLLLHTERTAWPGRTVGT